MIEIGKGDRVRLSFEQRAALVLDASVANGPYARLMRHYELRNRIAHGATVEQLIQLDAVIQDFHLIFGALEA